MSLYRRAENNTIPAPVILPPGDFGGNDGQWTTFTINLGNDNENTAGQDFRVMISTSSPYILIPDRAEWCTVPTQQECAKARGVQLFRSSQSLGYDSTASSHWQQYGTYDVPLEAFPLIDWSPDPKFNASWGFENVGLGPSSPTTPILEKQLMAQVHSKDFFMGIFGLSQTSINPGNGGVDPFFVQFNNNNKNTPSKSYSYTAGAHYRNDSKGGVQGSVILGGRDVSRFTENGVSMGLPNNQTLLVGVQDITYTPDKQVTSNAFSMMNGSTGFYAVVDSTLPYFYLPGPICNEFKDKFQLDYDEKANMYWVSDSAHDQNKKNNATVSIRIGEKPGSQQFTSIRLPYDAFDLTAGFPLNGYNNNTGRKFFPMKQAPKGVFILGRTFLQEAYLTVDYERGNFSIAPALFSDPMPSSHVVPILSTSAPSSSPSSSSTPIGSGGGGGGLSPGAVAGIVVGIVIAFLLGALVAFLFWKKKHKKAVEENKPPAFDTVVAGDQIKPRRVSELDSEPPGSPEYYARRNDQKDVVPFPPLDETHEMDSPPVELWSPPITSSLSGHTENERDYFGAAAGPRRRGATRESSGKNTPGIPENLGPHELPAGDDVVAPVVWQSEDARSPDISPIHSRGPSDATAQTGIDTVVSRPDADGIARRPSQHIRGPSDAPTESTAVSEPTAEDREAWAQDSGPRRPLSG
ncbi:aspartic peptidase domain-containing protein [Clohesyomyces aquaticus]|uniref:Aspartic peptidase domain-containing protein n=1 Tax=Clohesyomyces aquaticus TaxID=1231657 RepID=A0A1Y2A4A9_9PLEO|nr:aspartic peptidase domain-containing protein [Clohesyomyces aquaticus]